MKDGTREIGRIVGSLSEIFKSPELSPYLKMYCTSNLIHKYAGNTFVLYSKGSRLRRRTIYTYK